MISSSILTMVSPLLFAPWNKELEAACKEASKKIEKKAKSTVKKKLTKALIEDAICAEAGKLDKRLTQVATGILKKGLDAKKKSVEADLKKKDPGSPQALKLEGLRDELDKAKKERKALENGKPLKLPKPMGGGMHVKKKIKVFTKDKVEMDIEFFMGIDAKSVLKGKPKDIVNYGGANLIFRF